MTSRVTTLHLQHQYTTLKRAKALLRRVFKSMLVLFDNCLQPGKEFFNRVQIWRVRRQAHELDAGLMTHLLDPLGAMKGRVVYYERRILSRPCTAIGKELLYVFFEHCTVRPAWEHTWEQNPVLGVCWQNLVSLVTVKSSYLYWCYTIRGPACSPEPDTLIRFVDEDKMVRVKFR